MTFESITFDSIKQKAQENLNPVDFARGLYDSALVQPGRALKQLAGFTIDGGPTGATERPDSSPPVSQRSESLAFEAGSLVGSVVDFAVLSKVTSKASGRLAGVVSDSSVTLAAGARQFFPGAIYGGVFTPSDANKSVFEGRLENAAVSGATFAVMGAAGKRLEPTLKEGEQISLKSRLLNGAIAGGAGGVVNTFGSVYFAEHRVASASELAEGAAHYAAFGVVSGALDAGVSHGVEKVTDSNKYYQVRWKAEAGMREARSQYYSALDATNMRHPLQRIGNYLHGTDFSDNGKLRVPLTAENNPVNSFESALPDYFSKIDAKVAERDLAERSPGGDRNARYRNFRDMEAIKADFAHRLLQVWHGTSEQPGMAHHTDTELATASTPVERVAEIRQALMSRVQQGPFSARLGDLAGRHVDSFDSYEISPKDILDAKAKYFQFDLSDLTKRMQIPDELAPIVRNGTSTPITYLPFDATDNLPNLFHGSSSVSLSSVFTERGILSSRELRARGLEQVSGESKDGAFGRRDISITRDFTEALAYSNIDSYYLNGYPVIFGISSRVIPRASYAGLSEPNGEMLVGSKLRIGDSMLSSLGIRQPDVTHIYVPDPEVASVNKQLANHRLTGVNVVGFSELPSPAWNPLPAEAQDWFRFGY